jgi:Mn2+/Fe2+ NRAMP family transporter
MLPWLISGLQSLNDPTVVVYVVWAFIVSYYLASWGFLSHEEANYRGAWRKSGIIDIASSVIWLVVTIFLILSLIDLLIRNRVSLGLILHFYVFFLFLFAFVYNILEWHDSGQISPYSGGWAGELRCLVMSIEIMTSSPYTSTKPAKLLAESIAAIQSLLGIAFVTIFIVLAVTLIAQH